VKRVVTGVDGEGRSYVVSAEELPNPGTVEAVELWRYQPSDIEQWIAGIPEEAAATAFEPPPGAAWWVAATFPTGGEPVAGPEYPGVDEQGFHATRTIDFGYLLSGEVTLVLDSESVRITAGDVVVQQAARHAWRNEGTEPAVLLVLLNRPV
jgi:mannose-6-phosphate isomerase-like protein (cupin superfamily)